MRVLIDIGHPAQVHFFKNIIWNLEDRGHEVKITLRNRDVAKYLLDMYGFKYDILINQHYKGLLKKAIGVPWIDYKLYKIAKNFNPDILVAETSYVSHVGKLLGKPTILFCNNEYATLENFLFLRYADVVCTPTCFEGAFNIKRQVKYNGYFFLPYLHPNYFKPDSSVLDEIGLEHGDKFIVLRFRTYDAAHDRGQNNIDSNKHELIKQLELYGKVFIKSDVKLTGKLKNYELPPVEKMHDLLYFADLYVGDGISMAAEAAIIGTPAILVSTLTWGYIKELRDRYQLIYTCRNAMDALKLVSSLQEESKLKELWNERKEKMLNEKIDVVEWTINVIENYDKNNKYNKYNK